MNSFEKYLIESGYKRFLYNKEMKLVEDIKNDISYSSMDKVVAHYIKNDINICYGLHEYKHPPTLISPRNFIDFRINYNDFNEKEYIDIHSDGVIDRLFKIYSNEQVLDAIENDKKLILEYKKE